MEALAQYNETTSPAKTISAYIVCLRDLHISYLPLGSITNRFILRTCFRTCYACHSEKQNNFVYKVLKTEYSKNSSSQYVKRATDTGLIIDALFNFNRRRDDLDNNNRKSTT